DARYVADIAVARIDAQRLRKRQPTIRATPGHSGRARNHHPAGESDGERRSDGGRHGRRHRHGTPELSVPQERHGDRRRHRRQLHNTRHHRFRSRQPVHGPRQQRHGHGTPELSVAEERHGDRRRQRRQLHHTRHRRFRQRRPVHGRRQQRRGQRDQQGRSAHGEYHAGRSRDHGTTGESDGERRSDGDLHGHGHGDGTPELSVAEERHAARRRHRRQLHHTPPHRFRQRRPVHRRRRQRRGQRDQQRRQPHRDDHREPATQDGFPHHDGEPQLVGYHEQFVRALHKYHPARHKRARRAALQSARSPPEPAQLPVAGSRDQFRHIGRCLPVVGSPEHHDASGDFAQERQYHLEGIAGGY